MLDINNIIRLKSLKTKKWFLVTISSLIFFSFGSIFAYIVLKRQFALVQNKLKNQSRSELDRRHDNFRLLRQHSLVGSSFLRADSCLADNSILDDFIASDKNEIISMAYTGGYGGSGWRTILYGDGNIRTFKQDGSQQVTAIPRKQCEAIFRRFIASGILNYHQPVVDLKMALLTPENLKVVTDLDDAEFKIFIPKYGIDRTVVVYAPALQHQNYPDILELRIASTLESEFLNLMPKEK